MIKGGSTDETTTFSAPSSEGRSCPTDFSSNNFDIT